MNKKLSVLSSTEYLELYDNLELFNKLKIPNNLNQKRYAVNNLRNFILDNLSPKEYNQVETLSLERLESNELKLSFSYINNLDLWKVLLDDSIEIQINEINIKSDELMVNELLLKIQLKLKMITQNYQ